MYLCLVGGGEENKRSYVPGGQALMMGLQKSHSWWHRHGAAISGAPSGLWLETLIELRKVSEAAVCAWGVVVQQPCACTLMGTGVFRGAGELSGLFAH